MKDGARVRRILHIDLDPFFVGVERMRDATLARRPLVVGGNGPQARVAAASEEARAAGVRVGQTIARARELCPEAVVRPGDFEAYARASQDVTAILLGVSRRVERPTADEAFVDLSADATAMRQAVLAAEGLRDELRYRMGGIDAAFGLASSRLAARVASRWARPRGLVLLLPEHETSFLDRQPVGVLDDLGPDELSRLTAMGVATVHDLRVADPGRLRAAIGRSAEERLRLLLDPSAEPPVTIMAPPQWVQEDLAIRDDGNDRETLESLLDGLVRRARRRLLPFDLAAGSLTVEVRRGQTMLTRTAHLPAGVRDERVLCSVASRTARPLLDPAHLVRGLRLRLARLTPLRPASSLFPDLPVVAHG
jgi:DNA polymerase-4